MCSFHPAVAHGGDLRPGRTSPPVGWMRPPPALLKIVHEPCCGPFERHPLGRRVISVRNDDPDVLLPVTESGLSR